MREWRYIGDGVYANYDGFHILLRKNSHENEESEIALEPDVFHVLVNFAQALFFKKVSDETKEES